VDDTFGIISSSPDSLVLQVGAHGLDGQAEKFFDFALAALASSSASSVTLDGSAATIVTLEGVAVLLRLSNRAREADKKLRVSPMHPALEQKLAQTGTLTLFVP
jgi:anti-anti-sigma regulatory factor